MRTRTPSYLKRVTLLGASLALVFLMFEVGLRVTVGPPVHFVYPQEFYVAEEGIGYWLTPDQQSFTHDKPVATNSKGIRDETDHPRTPPAGRGRIFALGDSQTFGNGLAFEDTWTERLEEALPTTDTIRGWDVLNTGMSGTDTWHHAYILQKLAPDYGFDAIVLAAYVNDVQVIYERPRVGGLTNTWRQRFGYLLKRSAVFTLGWQTYQRRMASTGTTARERRLLTGEPDEKLEAGWRQVERSLGEIRDFATERGAKFFVVVLPRRDQVDGTQSGVAYNERYVATAQKLGIPAIDLLPALQEAYEVHGRDLFIAWDGHNAAITNAVIAREIGQRFAPELVESMGTR